MATEIKSDQIKSEKLVAIPSANKPTSPAEGMVFRADGSGDSAKGLYEYKNSKWVSLDQSLDSMESVSLITSGDTSALQFAAALNSTSTAAGHKNAVPHETALGSISGTFTVPTAGSDALFTDRNANLVFRYASSGTASCKNEYVGITIDIPAAFRGQNLVAEFQYRTEESTTASSNNDFQLSVWDKTNGKSITSTDTSLISAGNDIAVSSKTGLTVGDKIWLESGGNAVGHADNTITQSYITAISGTADTITISADWTPASTTGSVLVTKFLSDYDIGLPEADSDTDKDGSTYKLAFKTEATTAQVNLYWQNKSTTANSLELFFDGILISANKFLQASSQTKSESYAAPYTADFWNTGTGTGGYLFDKALLTAWAGTPPLAQSNLITISDITGPGTTGTVTAITAKQSISLTLTAGLDASSTGQVVIYKDDGNVYSWSGADGEVSVEEASIGVSLSKNEYVYVWARNPQSRTGYINILAQPQTSDVILLESQEEIFTDWTAFTPTGTWTTNATYTGYWRRNGSNMEIRAKVTMAGAPNSSTLAFNLPSGYAIAEGVGTLFTSNVYGDNNFTFGRSWMQDGGGGNDDVTGNVGYESSTSLSITASYADSGFSYIKEDPVSQVVPWTWANLDSLVFEATVPIQGWNANFNPLLSMPLVDFSTFENTYSARVTRDSTSATLTSQSGNFIASVAHDSTHTGTIDITFVSGFFTQIPSVVVTPDGPTGNQWASASSIATTGCSVHQDQDAGGGVNGALCVTVTRQGSDYRQPPQPTAAVIKPAVAILRDIQAVGASGGEVTTAMDDSVQKRTLNTIYGESWFVTLSSSVFTLEPGQYKFSCRAPFYQTVYTSMGLYDVTNSAWVPGARNALWSSTSTADSNSMAFDAVTTITSSTQFQLGYTVNSGHGVSTWNLGVGQTYVAAEAISVFAEVMIEKLK